MTGSSGWTNGDEVIFAASEGALVAQVQAAAQAQNQSNTQTQQNQQQSIQQPVQDASAGVLALGIGARALLGAQEGGEAGAALGSAEPGGGNLVGAVIGVAAGAVTAALAPTIYSKSKDAAKAAASQVERALSHLGKLGGPDKEPRRGWRQTVRDAANQIDKHADRIANKTVSNGLHLLADFIR